jgi:hypothetical protein
MVRVSACHALAKFYVHDNGHESNCYYIAHAPFQAELVLKEYDHPGKARHQFGSRFRARRMGQCS